MKLGHPPTPGELTLPLFVGVDAGIKHDNAAVVAVCWDQYTDRLCLACHRLWKPSPEEPLNLEQKIEWFLRELCSRNRVEEILSDPFQLHHTITTLQAAGLPIREFPQTVANCTLMGQTIFDLLNGRNLRLYPSAELRQQALSTVAVENPRGWRIAKEKTSKKIDAISALSMGCVSAVQIGKVSMGTWTSGGRNQEPEVESSFNVLSPSYD